MDQTDAPTLERYERVQQEELLTDVEPIDSNELIDSSDLLKIDSNACHQTVHLLTRSPDEWSEIPHPLISPPAVCRAHPRAYGLQRCMA